MWASVTSEWTDSEVDIPVGRSPPPVSPARSLEIEPGRSSVAEERSSVAEERSSVLADVRSWMLPPVDGLAGAAAAEGSTGTGRKAIGRTSSVLF